MNMAYSVSEKFFNGIFIRMSALISPNYCISYNLMFYIYTFPRK